MTRKAAELRREREHATEALKPDHQGERRGI